MVTTVIKLTINVIVVDISQHLQDYSLQMHQYISRLSLLADISFQPSTYITPD